MNAQLSSPKKFNFKSGVVIDATKDKVIATAPNYNKTIYCSDLDNFSYKEHSEQRLSFVGLLSRMFVIGLLLLIVNKVLFGKINMEKQAIFIGCLLMGISFLAFLMTVIDSHLELGISNSIMNNFFSNRGYYVTIGNKSGNNIELMAMPEDIELIKELEQKIYELKKLSINQNTIVANPINSNLDELKKLGELFQNGILTPEEFEMKKNELLNKV